MMMAERFRIPVVTRSTRREPSGIGSEERGQSEAIARNLFEMSNLARRVSVVTVRADRAGARHRRCDR